MTNNPRNYSRRHLLKLSGTALAATTLAGCTSTNNDNTATEPKPDTESDDTPVETTDTDDKTYNTATKETAREVAATVRESTVKVSTGKGGGTGWVLNAKTASIVTNSHVVGDHDEVRITTYDDTSYTGTVIGNVDGHIPDAALLEINKPNAFDAPALPLGDDTTLEMNDTLVQVGHPFRVGEWVVALGDYLQHNNAAGWFESTLPTHPGNSGGPVVNLDGELVGMTSGSTSDGERDRPIKHTESPPKLYTEYPEPEKLSTHVPVTAIEDLVESWTN